MDTSAPNELVDILSEDKSRAKRDFASVATSKELEKAAVHKRAKTYGKQQGDRVLSIAGRYAEQAFRDGPVGFNPYYGRKCALVSGCAGWDQSIEFKTLKGKHWLKTLEVVIKFKADTGTATWAALPRGLYDIFRRVLFIVNGNEVISRDKLSALSKYEQYYGDEENRIEQAVKLNDLPLHSTAAFAASGYPLNRCAATTVDMEYKLPFFPLLPTNWKKLCLAHGYLEGDISVRLELKSLEECTTYIGGTPNIEIESITMIQGEENDVAELTEAAKEVLHKSVHGVTAPFLDFFTYIYASKLKAGEVTPSGKYQLRLVEFNMQNVGAISIEICRATDLTGNGHRHLLDSPHSTEITALDMRYQGHVLYPNRDRDSTPKDRQMERSDLGGIPFSCPSKCIFVTWGETAVNPLQSVSTLNLNTDDDMEIGLEWAGAIAEDSSIYVTAYFANSMVINANGSVHTKYSQGGS